MGYIAAAIMIALAFVAWGKFRNIVNPITLFCMLWGIIVLCNMFGLFGLYVASSKTISVIFVGVISFALGAAVKLSHKDYVEPNGYFLVQVKEEYKYLYWILFGVTILLLAKDGFDTCQLLLKGYDASIIRGMYYGMSPGEECVYQYVGNGWFVFLRCVATAFATILMDCGIELFFLEKKNYIYVIASALLAVLNVIISCGRWWFLYFAIGITICFCVYHLNDKGHSINRKLLYLSLFIILTGILILMMSRIRFPDVTNPREFLESLYVYFGGCVPFLDLQLETFSFEKGAHSLGFMGFYGLVQFPFPIIQRVMGFESEAFNNTLDVFTSISAIDYISPTRPYNAFVSCFFAPYVDGGYVGEILEMLLFGVYSRYAFDLATKKLNIWFITPYLICAVQIIKSVQEYPFESVDSVITLIVVIVCLWYNKYVKCNNIN